MKTLKFLAITAFIFITLNISAQRKTPKDPLQIAKTHVDKFKNYVTNMTPDQENKIIAIERDFVISAKEVFTHAYDNSDIKLGKLQKLRDERDSRVKAVLTPSQYTHYLLVFKNSGKC
ncbi:MAG: hypothetical protein ACLQQ4_19415 [Bacteroidia bacterium]